MKMVNYTSLKKRDKNVYSIMGVTLPAGGIRLNLLVSILACELIFNIVGVVESMKTGTPYIDFSTGKSGYGMFFIIAPAVVGVAVDKIKIKGNSLPIYVGYAIKHFLSKKFRDADGNSCNASHVMWCLHMDDDQ